MSESGVYEYGQLPIYQGNPATDQIAYGINNETGQTEYGAGTADYINYVNQETAAGRPAYEYASAQYSGYLADQRAESDRRYEASPEGQAMSAYHQRRAESRGSDKGTFNIIAGIFAAVAVVLTAGTALGVFAAAGGLEGAVAAGVAEGAIEGGAAAAAVAEAAPAAAAIEAGGAAAVEAGAAAGAAEAAAPSVFSSIIDGATSVYDAVSGAIETVGNLTNISGPLSTAAQEAGVPSTVADLGAKTVVGAGRGALTSAIQGQDPGLGALGGAVSGLVGGGARALLGEAGLGTTGYQGGITGTLAGAAGGAASGAARAAATGTDIGQAALRGAATGGGSGFTSYLLSDALGLGNTAGAFGGSLASNLIGGALAPDSSGSSSGSRSSGTSRSRGTSAALSSVGGGLGGSLGGTLSGGGTGVADASGGTTTTGSPTTISSTALSSLLSTGTDPGYSSPISGDSSLDSDARPAPWNTASLKTTDPTGSSYG